MLKKQRIYPSLWTLSLIFSTVCDSVNIKCITSLKSQWSPVSKYIFRLTCTFGPGPQRWSRGSGASLQRSGQQNTDLILCVRIQVADLVCGLVYRLQVIHGAWHCAVLHLPVDDWAIPVDGVGVQLDPKIGGANSSQLGWCDRNWGL